MKQIQEEFRKVFDVKISDARKCMYTGLECDTGDKTERKLSQQRYISRLYFLKKDASFPESSSLRAPLAWFVDNRPDVACAAYFAAQVTETMHESTCNQDLNSICSAMCLAGREHSPTVKQKEEKQKQKQHCRWHALRSVRDSLSFYAALRPTVAQLRRGVRKDARPGRLMVAETCEDLSARRVRVGLVYENVTAVRWVVKPMLDERLQHLVYGSRSSTGACSALPNGIVTV